MFNVKAARVHRVGAMLVTAVAVVAGGLVAAEPAEAAAPALSLEASQSTVTVYTYDDGGSELYGDLGIYAVAGKKSFRVNAKRSSYTKPIVAKLVKRGRDTKLPTPANFDGLPRFFRLTFTNQAGKVVSSSTKSFCPNVYEPVRRRPSAPATSPYPQGCSSTPYALGAVWGIRAGYAVPLADERDYGALPALKAGTYRATASIEPAYRKALGLTGKQATKTVRVIVKAQDPCGPDDCAERANVKSSSAATASRLHAAAERPGKLTGQRVKKPSGPRPDLRSLPAWGVGVDEGRYLTFSATVWNAGPGRLVVDGFRSTKDADLMNAYQYFFTKSGKQKGYARVGGMEWDARTGHEHWHFKDFASYQLVDSSKKLVVRSAKESFCLANTDAVNYLVKGANWKPGNTDLQSSCGGRESLGVREVLDTGSGDTYAQYLPGQSFDLKGLPNGTYYIQIKANPAKKLYERKTTNNTSYRKVVIGGTSGARTVKVAKVGLVKEPPVSTDGEESGHR